MRASLARWCTLLLSFTLSPLHAAEFSSLPEKPWTAAGQVTTADGKPMPDVEIWVHAGIGSLHRTAVAKTDADGRYSVSFGRGVMMPVGDANLQVANVTAHLPGFFEKNLNRHGARAAALRPLSDADLKDYRLPAAKLFVPGQPQTINFEMAPAARVTGRLLGTGSIHRLPPQEYRRRSGEELPVAGYIQLQRGALGKWRLWIVGKELPPASSVLASAETDADGNFTFESVPVGFEWEFQVETEEPRVEPKSGPFRIEKAGAQAFELEFLAETKQLRLNPSPAQ